MLLASTTHSSSMPTAVYILRRRFNYDGRHPRLPTGYGGVQGQVSLSRTDSHPRAPHQLNKGRAPHPARPALALADPARAGRSTQPEWTHRALPEQSRASTHPRSGAAAAVSRASARCPAQREPRPVCGLLHAPMTICPSAPMTHCPSEFSRRQELPPSSMAQLQCCKIHGQTWQELSSEAPLRSAMNRAGRRLQTRPHLVD
jgi:hypothetical protein